VTLQEQMTGMARAARSAARGLALLSGEERNAALRAMAAEVEARSASIAAANEADLDEARTGGMSGAMLDRLALTPARIAAMARGLNEVADLPDPVGRLLQEVRRPNGLRLRKVSSPLGVILIIYESRPNVTADAAALCFKAASATILRGGREALRSNRVIAEALTTAGCRTLGPRFPSDAIQVVPVSDREAIPALLALPEYIDLCMPRGGEGLIRAVTAAAKVPVIKHYKGVCHVFVDRDADLTMAADIVENAKVQRPSTCNAMETLLVDAPAAERFLPQLALRLAPKQVEWRADPSVFEIMRRAGAAFPGPVREAADADYDTEYNDYVMNVRVVDGVDAAMGHIRTHGSAHSDAIVTRNAETARRFLNEVDSAAVYWNASTRFTDGGEFGMGAEIGISTDKLHARGPMGLGELCTYKWLCEGDGQVRA
jgi:glutamate-5-semialdehyde dehydrogenase